MKLYILCALLCFAHNVFGTELPDFIEKCALNDPEVSQCIKDAGNKVIPQLVQGVPSFGIPPLAPLRLSEYELDGGSFKLMLRNVNFNGFQDLKIRNIDFDFNNKNWSAIYTVPRFNLSADYALSSANAFLRTSLGGGKIYISLVDNTIKLNATLSTITEGEATRVFVDSITARLKTRSTHYRFSDIYANIAGDFHEFLNKHNMIIEGRLQPSIAKFITKQIRMVFDAFSQNSSLQEVFIL